MFRNHHPSRIEIAVIIEAARQISDSEIVIAGSGVPLYVAAYALQAFAPRLSLVLDGGLVDPISHRELRSVSDPEANCIRFTTMSEVLLNLVLSGRVQCGIIGAAQVDRLGNINSSYVSGQPRFGGRLPGAGGATAIAAGVRRLIIVMPHELRRFPYQCRYISSVGNIQKRLLKRNFSEDGVLPELVIVTDLCLLGQRYDDGLFEVAKIMPGITFDEIQHRTGFALKLSDPVAIIGLPSQEEANAVTALIQTLASSTKQEAK